MKKTEKEEKERIDAVLAALDQEYGSEMFCHLHYENPWELLVAVILSAQCTDARVNLVTPELFKKYPTPEAFSKADQKELEKAIYTIGFYHSKAAHLIGCAKRICEVYKGEVPSKLEELLTLPGVGRKTANVIRGNIYHEPSIVVDTHVKRISGKLGFTKEKEPEKIEFELMKVLPKDHWIRYNIQIITFGRTVCTARSPKCSECFLRKWCPSAEDSQNR